MFADAELDLKKRCKEDTIIESLIALAGQNFFVEHFEILAAVFNEKGLNKGDHLELNKGDFISLLKDSNILIIQKQEKGEGEGKGKAAKAEGKLKRFYLILCSQERWR
jgi:hypothetical protein